MYMYCTYIFAISLCIVCTCTYYLPSPYAGQLGSEFEQKGIISWAAVQYPCPPFSILWLHADFPSRSAGQKGVVVLAQNASARGITAVTAVRMRNLFTPSQYIYRLCRNAFSRNLQATNIYNQRPLCIRMDAITLSRSFLSRRARLPIDGAYAVTRLIRCERIPETGFLSGLASNAKVRIANLLFPHCQTISPSSDHVLGIIERAKAFGATCLVWEI